MMSKMFALITIYVCLAAFVNSAQIKVNRDLENSYRRQYGTGKPVEWSEVKKMSKDQLGNVCRYVHEKTGFGVLGENGLAEAVLQDAYLAYSTPKTKKTHIQVLACKKNNKEQYVYHLTKGLSKDSTMLVYPVKNVKIDGKPVFTFTRRDQITHIPVLMKA